MCVYTTDKKKMAANISNIFSAIISFFIALLMIYVNNPVMDFMFGLTWGGITGAICKMVLMFAWLIMVILLGVYFPIHQLTAQD